MLQADWLEKAIPAITERTERYSKSEIRFNLMAVIKNRKDTLFQELQEVQKLQDRIQLRISEVAGVVTNILTSQPTKVWQCNKRDMLSLCTAGAKWPHVTSGGRGPDAIEMDDDLPTAVPGLEERLHQAQQESNRFGPELCISAMRLNADSATILYAKVSNINMFVSGMLSSHVPHWVSRFA